MGFRALEHARRLEELLQTWIRTRRRIQGCLECGRTLGIENEVAPVQQRLSVAHPPPVGRSFVGAHHSLKVTLQRAALVPQGLKGRACLSGLVPGAEMS